MKIAILPGDGIGTEIVAEAVKVLDALELKFETEHAPWALQQYGFRAIIAPSYADIFFNNCFKNGLLPIVLPDHEVAAFPGYALTIDLERQVVVNTDGKSLSFDVEPFRKYCLLGGYDDVALTLRHADKIRAFEAERLLKQPWLATTIR